MSSQDCDGELRCIDEQCVVPVNNLELSFYWESGDHWMRKEQWVKAMSAYEQAINIDKATGNRHPELACVYANAAMQASENDPAALEAVARRAHACVRALPNTSQYHQIGMTVLAELTPAGFSAKLLKQGAPAKFLTKELPSQTQVPSLEIEIKEKSGEGATAARDLLLKQEKKLLSCSSGCTIDKPCKAQLKLKSRFVRAVYKEDDGYKVRVSSLKINASSKTEDCLEETIEDLLRVKALEKKWDAELEMTLAASTDSST